MFMTVHADQTGIHTCVLSVRTNSTKDLLSECLDVIIVKTRFIIYWLLKHPYLIKYLIRVLV